jgi:aspartyl-tRNA(Asn)/glutamyl-tRNA(Gln) amidotransferase subunit B
MSAVEKYGVQGYLPTIGIECHVQLKTKTKLFAGVDNDARGAAPNTLISHICLGMPGALPVLNEKAVEYATRSALALKTLPQGVSYFERKHYFYPDLPKGYQITQLKKPIVVGGTVTIETEAGKRNIQVNRVQLEEDAGKNTHPEGADYSLVDLNRAGTPLLEIVSEPDIHSAEEAKAYAKELYILMKYAEVSDVDLYHGNMRFDVNVSVANNGELGTRTETKNLNSFKSVEKAVEYEIKRQIELIEKGELIAQETRGWDDAKQKTISQRGKEEAHDYRYFPEPDIPPVVIDDNYIENVKKSMPELPDKLRSGLNKLGLDSSAVETIVDALPAGRFMIKALDDATSTQAKRIANWLATDVQAIVFDTGQAWETLQLEFEPIVNLAAMSEKNEISSTGAKKVLQVLVTEGGDAMTIAKEHDLLQVSDEGEIEKIVEGVLSQNKQAAEDVKNGEMKAIGFLVGQVMKESKGKANPRMAQELIKKQLGL